MFATNHQNDNANSCCSVKDVCDVADQAGRKVRVFVDSATHEARDVVAATKKEIRSKPVQSSLIALAAGYVLSALLSRK